MCCGLRICIGMYAIAVVALKGGVAYFGYKHDWMHGDAIHVVMMVLYSVHMVMHVVLLCGVIIEQPMLLGLYQFYVGMDMLVSLGLLVWKIASHEVKIPLDTNSTIVKMVTLPPDVKPKTMAYVKMYAPDIATIIADFILYFVVRMYIYTLQDSPEPEKSTVSSAHGAFGQYGTHAALLAASAATPVPGLPIMAPAVMGAAAPLATVAAPMAGALAAASLATARRSMQYIAGVGGGGRGYYGQRR